MSLIDRAAVSLLLIMTSTTSIAQASTADQSTPLGAAAEEKGLEEIVVTAQRRSENLQDVPIAIAAVSGKQLSVAGVNNLVDMRVLVPGLTVTNSVGYATTRLRGVGSGALGPGLEAPIALYVDGVYYAASNGNLTDFVSVSQIEVT
ncbi:TonB-dependent receptor [Sphingobium indicum BiD32]|uniref:TonB-dependent receptor n=1 Tax=Sphingobium indicum BiD32 TaxID=1301087 RepID=N1MRC7_9SPHN|nr:TonB-dependent receptor plug domain-containing protein [Sphingobium indicum]CCW19760.1 TonB-dependent receptor [Sphingobium indicum BiD32]